LDQITRQTRPYAHLTHSKHEVVEFPQTGRTEGESVLHLYDIDPNDDSRHFRNDIQYSLGGETKGITKNRHCSALQTKNANGTLVNVPCSRMQLGCKYTLLPWNPYSLQCCVGSSEKRCDFVNANYTPPSHSSVRPRVHSQHRPTNSAWEAKKECFIMTLTYFSFLQARGCLLVHNSSSDESDEDEDEEENGEGEKYEACDLFEIPEYEVRKKDQCRGNLKLVKDKDNRFHVQ
jgi:hypothetical protein